MGKAHPVELRVRVIAFVEEGHGHREAARHFRVSPKFVNDMVKLKRETGGLLAKPQGKRGHGKLAGLGAWIKGVLVVRPGLTLDEIRDALLAERGVAVHRASVGTWLHRLGLSHKKTLLASETKRPEVARARHSWRVQRQPFMRNLLERLAFIDETSLKTNLIKATGWAPVGERLIGHAPFGHWNTQTFIAALRHDRLDAPWVIDGAINRELFDLYVQTQLVPTLRKGDVVILDNLSSHKSPKAAEMLRDIGAWFLPLPPYSPDLNPIEMAFAKLKTLIRKAAARTYDSLWQTVGHVCDLFTEQECYNYFRAAGYEAD